MSTTTIDVATLKAWLEADQALLVDVREPAENTAKRIAGATLVPLGAVRAEAMPALGGRKLVVHCAKGGRGEVARARLQAQMPGAEIYNLGGGIEAWESAGQLVLKSTGGAYALDLRVQMAIGVLVLVEVLLGMVIGRGYHFW